jgi:basic amino acid/polyamine antiporter, APA family
MTKLARKLHLFDYFALAFGVMVGTGWLVVMDDILQRGGPLGAVLGFTAGALMLLPVGYVYGKLVQAIPDAASEVAYTARFFPPLVSFVTGWVMWLSYGLTCPFEALAAGRISGYLFPSMNTFELYSLGGHPVYLPHVLLGLAITAVLGWLNYRGIQASARFMKWTTLTFLTLVIIFALAGAKHGSVANLQPLFSHAPLLSVLLVWQIVPWLLSGFESVGKCAEEASPDFRKHDFSVAVILTIFVGLAFFWFVILTVAYVAPADALNSPGPFPVAIAFERALHAHWIVDLIMASALVAVLRTFNGNMIASSRLLFAMGRRNLIDHRMGYIHPKNQTPSTAVIAVAIATAAAVFLGQAGLVPILEVGAVAAAVGWMAACASYFYMKPGFAGRAAAVFGVLVTSLMILVKVIPVVPGHFTRYEWIAIAIWGGIGTLIRTPAARGQEGSKQQLQAAEVPSRTSSES